MSHDYGALARAVSDFTDQLEEEAKQARQRRHQAEVIARQLFPDIDDDDIRLRLRQFDVRVEEKSQTVVRLRRLLAHIASTGEAPEVMPS